NCAPGCSQADPDIAVMNDFGADGAIVLEPDRDQSHGKRQAEKGGGAEQVASFDTSAPPPRETKGDKAQHHDSSLAQQSEEKRKERQQAQGASDRRLWKRGAWRGLRSQLEQQAQKAEEHRACVLALGKP